MLKKSKLKRIFKKLGFLCCLLFLMATNFSTVYAGELKDAKLITGTVALAKAATIAITVLAVPVAGVLVTWQFFKLKNAEPEEEKGIRKKIKTIIIAGAGTFTGSGLIAIILAFYQ